MDFASLAAQYFDVSARITLGLSLLASGIAFLVMRLYMRAVMRESLRSASSPQAEWTARSGAPSSLPDSGPLELRLESPRRREVERTRSATFTHARQAMRRAAYSYGLAGAVHAAVSTILLFRFGFYAPPAAASALTLIACFAGVFWAWFFATIVALALFHGPDRRFRFLLFASYAAALPALGIVLAFAGAPWLPLEDIPMLDPDLSALMISFARLVTTEGHAAQLGFSPELQPVFFLTLAAAPFMIPVLGFNRLVRGTVGPVFITFALLMTFGAIFVMDLMVLGLHWLALDAAIRDLFGQAAFRVVISFALVAAAAFACVALLGVVWRYRRMKLSDQMFLFDALWLSVSICVCVYLMGNEPRFVYLLGLLPFVLYKLVLSSGLRHLVLSPEPLPNARLLFLRVFGSARRSEQLFDLLAAKWRYAGSVQLISATDMARSRFEPDEFLDFISGRFAERYIKSSADLERRLEQVSPKPDADGRHRVNEFFCRADMWQPTVTRLMASSDLVAMDLRGFTAGRRGCVFELGALIDHVPLQRVVLLVDSTTDMALLRQTLDRVWKSMAASSPNRSGESCTPSHVRIIDLKSGYSRAVRTLMHIGDELMLAN
jgi:hypothetical protein